jgi:hypothetical protein
MTQGAWLRQYIGAEIPIFNPSEHSYISLSQFPLHLPQYFHLPHPLPPSSISAKENESFFFYNCFIEINRGYVHMYTTTTRKLTTTLAMATEQSSVSQH